MSCHEQLERRLAHHQVSSANALAISRSKLCRWQQRKVFRQGVHWVRKNPAAPRSDQLWSLAACRSAPPQAITTRKGAIGPLFAAQ